MTGQTLGALGYRGALLDTDQMADLPAGGGTLQRVLASDVRAYARREIGAFGDPTKDATWASAAGAGVPILIPAGLTATISSPHTFTAPLASEKGALLTTASGVALSLNGGLIAGRYPVFANATGRAGEGSVSFNPAVTSVGVPEWWGGLGNNSSITTLDCAPAINACMIACTVTDLAACTYYAESTIDMLLTNRVLRGVRGWRWASDTAPMSRIALVGDGDSDVMFVGLQSAPTDPTNANLYVDGCYIENINFTRLQASNAPEEGFSGPAGLRAKWVYGLHVNGCMFQGSSNGVYVSAANSCHFENNVAINSTPSPVNTGNDYFVGFNIDQSVSIGLASGTASLYFSLNLAVASPAAQGSWGFKTLGGYTDLYIRNNETNTSGGFWGTSSPTNAGSAEDLHLTDNVFDGVSLKGVWLDGTSAADQDQVVTIANNYSAGSGAGVQLDGINGLISITGNQLGGGIGLKATNSSGFRATGNMMSGNAQAEVLANCKNFKTDNIINRNGAGSGVVPVVLTNCSVGVVEPELLGPAGASPFCVSIDSASSKIKVECTLIDAAVVGGPGNKIKYNGSAWGGGASFGTNCQATGMLAA